MRQNRLKMFCDKCGGEIIPYPKDEFALNVYSFRDFMLKVKEPEYVCSRCGKEFDEIITLYKEEL